MISIDRAHRGHLSWVFIWLLKKYLNF
jgi:hypothetical protein